MSTHEKEFAEEFAELARHRNKGQAFSDFIEIAALTIHQAPYHAGLLEKDAEYDRTEQAYMTAIQRFDKEELDHVVKLYSIATMALHERPHDFLGKMYMN